MKTKTIIKHITTLVMCSFIVFGACNRANQNKGVTNNSEIRGSVVADTIIYSVVINNLDPNDHWTEECLSQLNRKQFVDQLFESVYSHNAEAFDYLSESPLSISDVKAIEKQADFSREKVGKLQFWETWHYDEEGLRMTKTVHSILVAYEVTNQDNELLGYKAAFYIKTK